MSENVWWPEVRSITMAQGAMNLDWEMCSRARLARDARFDGKFYIAVLSTRIYCRPICPSRTSKEENVRYFPTAAAAAEAGFRPCLRCRPECSPGSPALFGTSKTVARALRLIGEAGLEDGGVELLAERLGIGSRHLRRLFLQHVGATPGAVANTRRLQFAKKLIDETTLPMTEIAFASGFGSVRRFNAAVNDTYRRTPTQIRSLAGQSTSRSSGFAPEHQYEFHLRFRPPFCWDGLLSFLGERIIPGVEAIEGCSYRRSISVNGVDGHIEVSLDSPQNSLLLRIHFADPRSLFLIIERVRAMFDLSADWAAIVRTLRGDPALVPQLDHNPGLRLPGCWSAFEAAILGILGQRVGCPGAVVLAGRLARNFGRPVLGAAGLTHVFPEPRALANADLASAGISETRAESVRALARAVCGGTIRFELNGDVETLLDRLKETGLLKNGAAQYVAMRGFREPDAFPAEAALVRALKLKNGRELEKRAEAWRPWRAYGAMYLLQAIRAAGNTAAE